MLQYFMKSHHLQSLTEWVHWPIHGLLASTEEMSEFLTLGIQQSNNCHTVHWINIVLCMYPYIELFDDVFLTKFPSYTCTVLWKWASFNTSFLNSCSTLVGSHVMFSIVLCCKKHLITFRESKDEFKLWILEHMTEHHQNLCTIPFSTSLGYKTEVKSQCYRWTRLHKTRKRF